MKNYQITNNKYLVNRLRSIILASLVFVTLLTVFAPLSVLAVESTFTTSLTTTGLSTLPPPVPTNFLATAVSSSQIDLSWTASVANFYSIAGYRIFRDSIFLATTSSTVYSDTGLTELTAYSYTIEAFDTIFQMSGQSATTSATTTATPTPTPVSGGGSGSSGTSINISNIKIIPGIDQAEISFDTNVEAQTKVQWGFSKDFEIGSLQNLFYGKKHTQMINGLVGGLTYQVRITASDSRGRLAYKDLYFTTILPDTEYKQIPNPTDFLATAREKDIKLTWTNPTDPRFNDVRIVRAEGFYPIDQFDGIPLYEGDGESFVDTSAKPGVIYYYAIFARDRAMNYSSGALAQARIAIPGEVVVPPVVDPFANLPQAKEVDPMIQALTLADFEFIQDGKNLEVIGETVAIHGDKNLTIRLKYNKVPEILKTVAFTLQDPSDPSKAFPFLLRINSDKTYYEATIGALGRSGRYSMSVAILDYENNGLKRINGTLAALAFSAPFLNFAKDFDILGLLILLLFIILIILAIILLRRWVHYHPEFDHKPAYSTHTNSPSNNASATMRKFIASVIVITISALSIISFVGSVYASFNPEINYQGKLVSSTNSIVPDGNYNIRFKLYTSLSGGSPIWTETWCNTSDCAGTGTGNDIRIPIVNGLFSTMLGSTTAFTGVDFNQPLYLGVEIGGSGATAVWDGEMSPRKILGAVPAAFYAGTSSVALSANTLDGLDSAQFFRNDTQNATSSSSTFLNIIQTGAGKIAEFFGSATQSVLALLSNGNVGIGTSTPSSKLSLVGGNFTHIASGTPTLAGTYDTSGFAYGVYVSGKYAFVADYDSGLQIIDISNPISPTLIGTYDTSGNANGVYVSGKYAYVADDSSGLQIIDISNPISPTLTGTYNTSGIAYNIYVSGRYAYVADGTAGLQIIDISNPTSPTLTVTYNTSGSARGVYISGKYAYVADGASGLQIIDISNPTNPTLTGTYDTSGFAYGVHVSGKYAYVADVASGLQIIDISNPTNPTLTGTYDTDGSSQGVYVSGKYAYVGDHYVGLQIIDISNPTNPTLTGTYDTNGFAYGVYVSGKYAYVADVASGLQIIDINGIETPSLYAGNIGTNDLTVTENVDIGNSLYVRNSLNIGVGGIFTDGVLSAVGTSSSYIAGNLGLGTTSPNWKLSVAGIGSFDDYVRASYFNATSTTATSTFAGGLSAAGSLGLSVLQNGNVGIGGVSSSTLYIAGSAGSGNGDAETSLYVKGGQGGTDGVVGGRGSDIFLVAGNGGDGAMFPGGGGNIYLSPGTGGFGTGGGDRGLVIVSGSLHSTYSNGYAIHGSLSDDSSYGAGVYGESSVNGGSGVYGQSNNAGGYAVYANQSDSSGYAIYSAGGKNYFENNLGLGTTSPNWKLSVAGIGSFDDYVRASYFTATSTTATSTFPNLSLTRMLFGSDYLTDITGSGLTISNGALSVTGAAISGAANMLAGFDASGNLTSTSSPQVAYINATSTTATSTFAGGLSVAGSSGLNVLQNGNIGIGTSSPGSKLTLVGGNFTHTASGNPTLAGAYDTGGGVNNIYVSGKYAYLANGVAGLKIINISNQADPTLIGTYDTSINANNVYVSGKYAFVADDNSSLKIIDISNPASPTLTGTYNTSSNPTDVYISGKYAYVTDYSAGLHIVDISNPANPILAGTYNTSGSAYGVYVSSKYAYVADDSSGLQIIDISNPSSPTLVGTYDTSNFATGVYVSGKYAYVADYFSGLNIIDISNPANPTLAGTYNTSGSAIGVYISGKYAYVADYFSGLNIIDISNPANPTLAGTYNTSGYATGVYVSGKYAYVADEFSGLQIIDINGIETPSLYAGNIGTNDLTVTENVDVGNSLYVRNSLNVGMGGIFTDGVLSVIGTSSSYIAGNLGLGTTSPNWKLSVAGIGSFDDYVRASYFTATSTTATSTFPNLSLTRMLFGSDYLTDITGTGLSISNGALSVTGASILGAANMLAGFDASGNLTSTSSPQVAYINATSTTNKSYFAGGVNTSGTTGGYYIDNNLILQASSTNKSTLLGYQAGASLLAGGENNTALGHQALYVLTSGDHNTSIGYQSLYFNTASYNSAQGAYSLYSNTSGSNNSAQGYGSLYFNTTGSYNSTNGVNSFFSNTTGSNNVGVGYFTSRYNQSATNTTAVGYNAGAGTAAYSNQGGTYVGYQSGYSASTGSDYNTMLGYQSGYSLTTGSHNILIGQNVQASSTNSVGGLNIGNVLFGTGMYTGSTVSGAATADGRIGIGTSSPNWKLSVAGIGSFDDYVRASYFTATSTTATSTFAGGLSVAGSTGLNVLQNGMVGIGTGAPQAFLNIVGQSAVDTDAIDVLRVVGGNGGVSGGGDYGKNGANIILTAGNGSSGMQSSGSPGYIYLTPGAYGDPGLARGKVVVDGSVEATQLIQSGAPAIAGIGYFGVKGSSDHATGRAIFADQSNSSGYALYALGGKNYIQGNLGLGTTSPFAKLSVAGIGSFDDYVRASYFTATSTTATSTFPNISLSRMLFGSDYLTDITGGGLSIVSNALTVTGLSSSTLANTIASFDASGNLVGSSTVSVAYGGTGLSTIPTYGQLLVGDGAGNYSLTGTSTLGILASSAIGIGTQGFIPYYAASEQALTATSSLFISQSSFIGIGTTTPTSALSVFSASGPQFQLAYDKDNYLNTSISSSGGVTMAVNGTAGGFSITNPQPASVLSGTGTNAPIGFAVTAGTGGNSLDTNIGVGGIGGGIQLTAGVGGTAIASTFSETGGAGGAVSITGGLGGSASSPAVDFMSRVAGIGGTLTLAGGAGGNASNGGLASSNIAGAGGAFILKGGVGGNATGATTNNGGAGGSMYLAGGAGGTGSSVNGSAGNLYLGYDSSNVIGNVYFGNQGASYIGSTGNFGIGTTSPYAKLSVVGETVSTYFTATSTTASTFPYASTTALTVSGTNGLQLATGLNGLLQAVNGLVQSSSTLSIAYGGTGLSTTPSYGQLLLGNASSGYTLTSTSSLGISLSSIIGNFGNSWELTNNIFSQSSLTPTTTQNIAISGIGTSTFAGGLEAWRQIASPYFHATSTTATSTFAGGLTAGGATGLYVLQNGNVGVGTAAPSVGLQVSGRTIIATTSSNLPYGSDLMANGNFASGDTGWTVGTGWATGTGAAVHTAGNAATLEQAVPISANGNYWVSFTMTGRTTGSISVTLGGQTLFYTNGAALMTSNTTYNAIASSTPSTANLIITPSSDFNGTLDNFYVREYTGNSNSILTLAPAVGSYPIEFRSNSNTTAGTPNNYANIYIGQESGYKMAGLMNTAIGTQTLNSYGYSSQNTAIGYLALKNHKQGDLNVAIGSSALTNDLTGANNMAIGTNALYSNISGSNNSAIGVNSLYYNTSGQVNTAMGTFALYNNTTASYNLGLGYAALYSNTTGANNSAVGSQALYYNTTGANNSAVGSLALYFNTSSYNTAQGSYSLYANTTGASNSAQGYASLYSNTTGNYNSAQGQSALYANTTGASNSALGFEALRNNTSATNTTAVGFYAGRGTANYNALGGVYLGYQAGYSAGTGGDYNTMLGYEAGYNTSVGDNALYAGYRAGYYATSSLYSTYLGYEAGRGNTGTHQQGDYNTAIGYKALNVNTTGTYNTSLGTYSMYFNTTGSNNVALGYVALRSNLTGSDNMAQGYGSLYSSVTGSKNTSVGSNALYYNTSATNTTAVGYQAGVGTANYNALGGVYLGYQAGYSAGTGGDYNTMLGYQSGYNVATGKYNIIIGQNVNATSSDSVGGLNIGNVLFGTGMYTGGTVSATPTTDGKIGIGTTSPYAKLSVFGSSATTPTFALTGYYNQTSPLMLVASTTGSATTTAFIIDSNGKVGIGTTTPWRTLAVTGTVGFDGLTGATGAGSICLSSTKELVYNAGSDACLPSLRETKHDINNLALDAMASMRSISPVSFIYNQGDNRTRYGFIAEDVSQIDTHLATYNDKGEISGIDDRALIALAIGSIKELDVRSNAIASSTVDLGSSLTELRNNMTNLASSSNKTLAEAIVALDLKVQALATSTADLIASTTTALASDQEFISKIATTSANILKSDSSFIDSIATAVKNIIASAGEWVVDRFTARIAYVTRVEAETVAISKGMEIVDQSNGSIWCVTIKNGDWNKVLGSCANVATSTPAVTPSPEPTPTPSITPVTDLPTPTPTPIEIIDNNSTTTVTVINATPTPTTTPTPTATSMTVVGSEDNVPTPTPSITPVPDLPTPTPEATPVPVETVSPEPVSIPVTEPSSQPVSEPVLP